MDTKLDAAMMGLAGKTSKPKRAKKAKLHLHIRPAEGKKFIVEHHKIGGDASMDNGPMQEHVMNNASDLAAHVGQAYGAPAPVADPSAGAPPPAMPGM
jgi:hypothetical protein